MSTTARSIRRPARVSYMFSDSDNATEFVGSWLRRHFRSEPDFSVEYGQYRWDVSPSNSWPPFTVIFDEAALEQDIAVTKRRLQEILHLGWESLPPDGCVRVSKNGLDL